MQRSFLAVVCFFAFVAVSNGAEKRSASGLGEITADSMLKRMEYFSAGQYFKKITKFVVIDVELDARDSLGLSRESLTDYTALRFKNEFANIPFDKELGKTPSNKLPLDEREDEFGIISVRVWCVGASAPVAYHVRMTGGTLERLEAFEGEFMGCSTVPTLQSNVEECIGKLMRGFAIKFFRLRGEI